MGEKYHQLVPERICTAVKQFLGRLVLPDINFNPTESPFDTEPEQTFSWEEEHMSQYWEDLFNES